MRRPARGENRRLGSCVLRVGALLICWGGCVSAQADEPLRMHVPQTAGFVQHGTAPDTQALTVGAMREWQWSRPWGEGLLTGHSEVSIGHWRTDLGTSTRSVTQIGITPTLRYYFSGERSDWFLEGGIGINYLTPNYRRGDHRFATRWNFGDHVALGRRFGAPSQHEVSLRLQHYSNGGLREPNPGENFLQLRYARYF